MFKDPFDPKTLLQQRCGCGNRHIGCSMAVYSVP